MYARHSILVDNDHGCSFAGGDQIIQDEIFTSLIAPTCFVFTPAMLEVQNRITVSALVVSWRRINENPSCLAGCLRKIPVGSHSAVWDIFDCN